jgi:hypothetical protein
VVVPLDVMVRLGSRIRTMVAERATGLHHCRREALEWDRQHH